MYFFVFSYCVSFSSDKGIYLSVTLLLHYIRAAVLVLNKRLIAATRTDNTTFRIAKYSGYPSISNQMKSGLTGANMSHRY